MISCHFSFSRLIIVWRWQIKRAAFSLWSFLALWMGIILSSQIHTKQSNTMQTVRFDRILKTDNYFSHKRTHRSFRILQIVTHIPVCPQFLCFFLPLFSNSTAFMFQETFVCIPTDFWLKWFYEQIILVITVRSPWRSSTITTSTKYCMLNILNK